MFKKNFKSKFKIMTWCNVVFATSELTQQSGSLTRLVSDLGRVCQKVHLYGTFVSGLHHNYGQFCNLKPARSRVDHGQSHKVDLQAIFAFKSVWTNEVNT